MKKAYIVCVYINIGSMENTNISSYMNSLKENLNIESALPDLLNANTMSLYIPVRTGDSRIEIHEFFLDEPTNKINYVLPVNTKTSPQDLLKSIKKAILNAV